MYTINGQFIYKCIRYICKKIVWFVQDVINVMRPHKLFVCGFFRRSFWGYCNSNWGDDINILFLGAITNHKVLVINNSFLYRRLPIKNFSCIGSIIGYYTNKYTTIWGSGLLDENMEVPYKPYKICSVRGPLTRNALLKKGIECPSLYGDPALLLSKFYQPQVIKKYKVGIIAHYVDEDNYLIKLLAQNNSNVLVISMTRYSDWKDIPNQICSCEKIISSSLHGLIISDSYGVPNHWVKFSNKIKGGYFKFHDYFASVGRELIEPTLVDSYKTLSDLLESDRYYLANNINFDIIIETCPFKNIITKYNAKNFSNSTSI